MEPEHRLDIEVKTPDEETLERGRSIMDKLKARQVFLSVGGEVTGEGPVWELASVVGNRELLLGVLRRTLGQIDPEWRKILTVS